MKTTNVLIIPYRFEFNQLQICMVTSRGQGKWLVPKGKREKDQTDKETASLEAYEEAGLLGILTRSPIKQARIQVLPGGDRQGCKVYLLKVEQTLDFWPEMYQRKRLWLPMNELDGLDITLDLKKLAQHSLAMMHPAFNPNDLFTITM